MKKIKLTYRPEIDGLRAIAIFSVIIYHFQINIFNQEIFPGGFLGVDIFFVISGFLITTIVLNELKIKKTFSFLNFYERRARRILPLLFFIILFFIPVAFLMLLPNDLIDFSKSILSVLFFISNFYFHYTGNTYGADLSSTKEFLHTWSLSVEEQFYIIFPLAIVLVIKYFKKFLLEIFIIISLISLLIAHWGSYNHPSANFYFLGTRFWEIASGGIVAYLKIKKKIKTNNFKYSYIVIASFFLIILSIFFYKKELSHPSLFTFPLIIAVCSIILFSNKKDVVIKILSHKIFIGIGLISYSLYLWHYPIITFYKMIDVNNEPINKIYIIIITFILSIISFFLIEKPFRNLKLINTKKLFTILLVFFSIILLLNIFIILSDGLKNRFKINSNSSYDLDKAHYLEEWHSFREKNHYINKFNSLKKKILIVGNSHGVDTFNIFIQNKELFKGYEFSIIEPPYEFLRKNTYDISCLNDLITRHSTICNNIDFTNYIFELYKKSDVILLSTRWKDADFSKLDDTIEKIKKDKKLIIILNNTIEIDNLETIYKFNYLDSFVYFNKRLPSSQELEKIEEKQFDQIKNQNKNNKKLETISIINNVTFLKKEDYLCNFIKNKCEVITPDNKKISFDYGHYTIEGSNYLGKKIYKTNWLKLINN
jgi:peptidoglycan/LPS O-acetylase OafA/YrhL